MQTLSRVAMGLTLIATLAGAGAAEAKSCGRYGGWGIGITNDIATFMSKKATEQAMEKDSAKPIAALLTTCNTNAIVYVQCHTTTKACSK